MKKDKKMTTSRVALIVFVLICTEILIYTEVVMYRLADLSALSVLIGIPAALATALIGYFFKSTKENTEGGVTYMTALHQLKNMAEGDDLTEVNLDDENAVG